MDEKQKKSFKSLIRGYAAYTSASIIGPLVLFGGLGYFIDTKFGTKPLWMLVLIGFAFIFTNFFLFRKAKDLTKEIEGIGKENEKEEEEGFDK